MEHVDEHLERMIGRSLDGELPEEEQLELDRELIRDPAAHAMMRDYREIDERAGQALRSVLDSRADSAAAAELTELRRGGRRVGHAWLWASGAVAAAILAMVIPHPAQVSKSLPPIGAERGDAGLTPALQPMRAGRSQGDLMRSVSTQAPAVRRSTGRDLIGVIGEDGNWYWIEVERSRTIRVPERPASGGSASNPL